MIALILLAALGSHLSFIAVALTVGAIVAGLLVALLKLWPERDQIIAAASEHAVHAVSAALGEVQRSLEDARTQVARLTVRERELLERIAKLEERSAREIEQLQRDLHSAQRELEELRQERTNLRVELDKALARVADLEAQIAGR